HSDEVYESPLPPAFCHRPEPGSQTINSASVLRVLRAFILDSTRSGAALSPQMLEAVLLWTEGSGH
ncbi:MAG: hypothetical protein WCF23_16825, partial [Candidatus Nitrosopolaris sp.]